MAKFTVQAVDEFAIALSKLETGSEAIAKKAIYKSAGILTQEIRKNLSKVLSDESTGALEKSLGIAPIKEDDQGFNTKIGFSGYDKNKIPNPLKARILESGSSVQGKKPFIRPAVNKTRKTIIKVMNETIENEIKKIIGGK